MEIVILKQITKSLIMSDSATEEEIIKNVKRNCDTSDGDWVDEEIEAIVDNKVIHIK